MGGAKCHKLVPTEVSTGCQGRLRREALLLYGKTRSQLHGEVLAKVHLKMGKHLNVERGNKVF